MSNKNTLNDSAGKTISCRAGNCQHYLAVKNRNFGSQKKNGLSIDDIDWDHMYNDHLRLWGEYGWEELVVTREKLRALEDARKQQTVIHDIDADPRNHVEGFCDALISSGESIWKCTDPVRWGKKVCSRHLKYPTTIVQADSSTHKRDDVVSKSSRSRTDLKHERMVSGGMSSGISASGVSSVSGAKDLHSSQN